MCVCASVLGNNVFGQMNFWRNSCSLLALYVHVTSYYLVVSCGAILFVLGFLSLSVSRSFFLSLTHTLTENTRISQKLLNPIVTADTISANKRFIILLPGENLSGQQISEERIFDLVLWINTLMVGIDRAQDCLSVRARLCG